MKRIFLALTWGCLAAASVYMASIAAADVSILFGIATLAMMCFLIESI